MLAGMASVHSERSLRRWHYFAVLAEEMNFTRAAARLHIAQPSLSQQIKSLERDLGVPLLNRAGSRFTLTDAGEQAVVEIAPLLRDYQNAIDRIRDAGLGRAGELRIAYTHSSAAELPSTLVARFRAANPQTQVRTRTGWTARNITALQHDEVDVAFVRAPVDAPYIETIVVADDEIAIVVPSDHPLAGRAEIAVADIAREPVVLWPRENGPGAYDSMIAQLWPDRAPTIVHEEPDDEQLLLAVAAGSGIAPIVLSKALSLRTDGVEIRRIAEPRPSLPLAVAVRAEGRRPIVERFLAMAAPRRQR